MFTTQGRRDRRGLTLIETLVALFLFAIFGLTAAASLNMALRQWGGVAKKVNASQNARFVSTIIGTELRQGLPNPIPALGYLAQGLQDPTAVLTPNKNQTTADELIFTEMDPANYTPLSQTWNINDPNNYRRIRYFVQNDNTEVVREETTYTSAGSVADTETEVVASGQFISLEFAYRSDNLVDVTVRAREGRPTEYNVDISYTSRTYIMGR